MISRRLDTPGSRLYKARAFAAAVLVLWSFGALAEQVMGAQIPDGAQKVGENRYRSNEDFKGTLKRYDGIYPKSVFPRRSIVNQPGVKAVHIVNPSGKNFEGINIYEANDEVRIYVVPAGVHRPVKKKSPEPKKK